MADVQQPAYQHGGGSTMEGRLSPELRAGAVAQMTSSELDVLVVGGGVVGAGAALDAVTRGLSVGLIEMQDWASGSSSRSSMIIDGGLSYLDAFELGRMRAGLRERDLLFDRIAPHLVHRVPFLLPLRHSGWERMYVSAALSLVDAIGHSASPIPGLAGHRQLSRRSVRRIAPGLRPDLTGAVQFFGAEVDDARYVTTLVRTAVSYGALAASRMRAVELLVEDARVVGVLAEDAGTGKRHPIRAKVVLAAAGVWTDQITSLTAAKGLSVVGTEITAHKGVHVVVPRDRIRSSTGVINRNRTATLQVVPWGRHWILGTVPIGNGHPASDLDRKPPTVSSGDIQSLLTEANQVLRSPLTPDDVQGAYAGLWPQLISTRRLAQGVREHRVTNPAMGLVMVTGGTFSQYRLMAVDAVDAAANQLGGLIADSITEQVPLIGADGYLARWNQRHLLARRSGLHVARVEHLLNRYGSMADELMRLVTDSPELRAPVPGAEDYLAADLVYAVSHEGAMHLTDLLVRRTRIAIETWDHGERAAPYVAELVAGLLGWDRAQTSREIDGYLARIEAEHSGQASGALTR